MIREGFIVCATRGERDAANEFLEELTTYKYVIRGQGQIRE